MKSGISVQTAPASIRLALAQAYEEKKEEECLFLSRCMDELQCHLCRLAAEGGKIAG